MKVWQAIRTRFFGGLFVLLPLFVTVWVVYFLFRIINRTVTPWVIGLLEWSAIPVLRDGWVRLLAPFIALVLTAGVIGMVRVLAGDVFGRRLLRAIDGLFLRVPVVKGVYGSARQLMDAFTAAGTEAFRQVVLVEYPRQGLFAIGFSTGNAIRAVSGLDRDDLVTVFLPTTPNPTSGMMIVVPRAEVQVLPMTVEEGLKLIVSGGIVVPQR